jgi:acyl CoA:acetate/3-ketoacid CoA transferase alpha subunit
MSKMVPLSAMADLVSDGDLVGKGGAWSCDHPMAADCELIRGRRERLAVVTMFGAMDIF